ncbi:MAG: MarR family winged helix-turn-helix transcriptional regulator [Candidatus Korobacteraceae bacterium]
MCANLRRASRALTQQYEEILRPLGLRATQFTILQALSKAGEVSQSTLGRILAMDTTTLTRTLEIMRRHGWVAERRGDDRRERLLRLAKNGRKQLQRALPAWEKVQGEVQRQLGDDTWHALLNLTYKVASLVPEKGELS